MIDLDMALTSLTEYRPVFHSEADFQFALAWHLRETSGLDVRLEYRPFASESMSLDLLVLGKRRVAIELKHMTQALDVVLDGERIVLKNQGAHDIISYDCVKDIARLERFVSEGVADFGYLVVLANDSLYWRTPRSNGAGYDAFRLTHGRVLSGVLDWGSSVGPGTTRGRENPLTIRGEYVLNWQPYSELKGQGSGEFQYLVVPVVTSATGDH